MSLYHIRSGERAKYETLEGATMGDRISRGYFGYSYLKIEAKITFFFRSKIINLSFNGLKYNMGEHFAHR